MGFAQVWTRTMPKISAKPPTPPPASEDYHCGADVVTSRVSLLITKPCTVSRSGDQAILRPAVVGQPRLHAVTLAL